MRRRAACPARTRVRIIRDRCMWVTPGVCPREQTEESDAAAARADLPAWSSRSGQALAAAGQEDGDQVCGADGTVADGDDVRHAALTGRGCPPSGSARTWATRWPAARQPASVWARYAPGAGLAVSLSGTIRGPREITLRAPRELDAYPTVLELEYKTASPLRDSSAPSWPRRLLGRGSKLEAPARCYFPNRRCRC